MTAWPPFIRLPQLCKVIFNTCPGRIIGRSLSNWKNNNAYSNSAAFSWGDGSSFDGECPQSLISDFFFHPSTMGTYFRQLFQTTLARTSAGSTIWPHTAQFKILIFIISVFQKNSEEASVNNRLGPIKEYEFPPTELHCTGRGPWTIISNVTVFLLCIVTEKWWLHLNISLEDLPPRMNKRYSKRRYFKICS